MAVLSREKVDAPDNPAESACSTSGAQVLTGYAVAVGIKTCGPAFSQIVFCLFAGVHLPALFFSGAFKPGGGYFCRPIIKHGERVFRTLFLIKKGQPQNDDDHDKENIFYHFFQRAKNYRQFWLAGLSKQSMMTGITAKHWAAYRHLAKPSPL